jgi:predicted  nucleic acid-binding Zn-ribbon protein
MPEPTLSDLADVLIRTAAERAVAKCQKEKHELLAEIQTEIDPLYLEVWALRQENRNLKAEKMQLQEEISHLAGENEDLKTKIQGHPATRDDLLKFHGCLGGDLTTIKGELKEIRHKMDRMLDGQKRVKDEVEEVKPGTIDFPQQLLIRQN